MSANDNSTIESNKVLKLVVAYALDAFQKNRHRITIAEENVSLVELLMPLASITEDSCLATLSKTDRLTELLAKVLSAKSANAMLPAGESTFLEKALAASCCARLIGSEIGRGVVENEETIAIGKHYY